MILNQVIFWILFVEAVICLILLLPFGRRICQQTVKLLSSLVGPKSMAAYIANVVLVLVFVLFVANIHTVWKYQTSDDVLSDGLRIRLLMAQRDMYISGFALFLFVLLGMVYSSLETNIRLEKNLEAMEKQAKSASDGFKTLLDENDKQKMQLDKLKQLAGEEGSDVLDKLLTQNSELQHELESNEKVVKEANRQCESIKKQAESQQTAYMKLLEENQILQKEQSGILALKSQTKSQADAFEKLLRENESLKSQLKDFDFMFADKKKKDL